MQFEIIAYVHNMLHVTWDTNSVWFESY